MPDVPISGPMALSADPAPAVSSGSAPAVGSLSLLVPGSFTDDDPYQGLESTLRLFEYGERLGFDGAWIRPVRADQPRYESPVLGIVVQTLATVVIAFPLALGYVPVIAFELLATILTAVMLCIHIVINISTVGYYLRKARDEFNLLLHLVLPAIGTVILIPVLAAAVGVGSSVLKFVSPLPYPISEAGLVVGIWFLIGMIYLAYLLRRHPERVHDVDKVFD